MDPIIHLDFTFQLANVVCVKVNREELAVLFVVAQIENLCRNKLSSMMVRGVGQTWQTAFVPLRLFRYILMHVNQVGGL